MHKTLIPQKVVLLGRLSWDGETVVCVASGPSAKDVDLNIGRGKAKFIVVNDSWRLCPWADALYACDPQWWRLVYSREVKSHQGPPKEHEFEGIRITQDMDCAREFGLRRVTLMRKVDKLLNKTPGLLGWGGNSGFHAVNIAVQGGASKIILVGYDMVSKDGQFHWHKKHTEGLNNPSDGSVYKWRLRLDAQAPLLESLGIKVINCSPISALQAYPKMSFEEALDYATNT